MQELEHHRWRLAGRRTLRQESRQCTTGAAASHREAAGIDAEPFASAATHFSTFTASSKPAGNGCSGASR